MRSLKVLCAVGMLSIFTSCTYQEDTAAFFIKNTLSENLVVERSTNEPASSDPIYQHVTLDLTKSESYDKYILRLTELDIVNFEFRFSNYQGTIENGQLYIDNVLLGDFNSELNTVQINDPQMLDSIEALFLEKTTLDFSFVGESQTSHYLSVEINVEMEGTFVH